MVKEAFAGLPMARNIQLQHRMVDMSPEMLRGLVSSSRYFKKVPQQEDNPSEVLREQVVKAGFVLALPWFGKVEQLLALTQLKHSKNLSLS